MTNGKTHGLPLLVMTMHGVVVSGSAVVCISVVMRSGSVEMISDAVLVSTTEKSDT